MTLEQTQNIIADKSFKYLGNSNEMIDIVNAVKSGKRLIDVESLKEQIREYWETCDNDVREEHCKNCNKIMFESVLGMVESEL